jgi:hypothetical protein
VQLLVASNDGTTPSLARILHENESIVVDCSGQDRDGKPRAAMLVSATKPIDCVRTMPKAAIKMLDLVDIVAGGDGFSGRRQRGIDPSSGRIADAPAAVPHLYGDGKYHPVEALPLIDGVFVPDGRKGAVQLDSAGHTCTEFPRSLPNEPNSAGYIWAGSEPPSAEGVVRMATVLGEIDYAAPGHGVLMMHANKGITFDLEAIRRAHPGCRLLRFLTMAGNTESQSGSTPIRADLWVFVDGAIRFQRCEINRSGGAFYASIPLQDKDCFLTLAATDGGDGMGWDWTLFGDPRLEILAYVPADTNTANTNSADTNSADSNSAHTNPAEEKQP